MRSSCPFLLGVCTFLVGCGGSSTPFTNAPPVTPQVVSITSGINKVTFPASGAQYALQLSSNGTVAVQSLRPVQVFVCQSVCGNGTAMGNVLEQLPVAAAYSGVTQTSSDTATATAQVTSPSGSVFQVKDVYQAVDGQGANARIASVAGAFSLTRTVTVATAGAGDVGFNTQFAYGFSSPQSLTAYHYLSPGILYDGNVSAPTLALASSTFLSSAAAAAVNPPANGAKIMAGNDPYVYWRETRAGLPFVMMQDPQSGAALSVADITSLYNGGVTPSSNVDETSTAWLTDSSILYGSIGVQSSPSTQIGFIYPAEEGSYTYTGGSMVLANTTPWSRRSHPVMTNFSHTYTLMLNLATFYNTATSAADYPGALRQTWRTYYNVFNPQPVLVPDAAVLSAGISVLNNPNFFTPPSQTNGAAGFPFSVALTPLSKSPPGTVLGTTWEIGYVGQATQLAYQLLRYAIANPTAADAQTSMTNGMSVLNFWAYNAIQGTSTAPLPPLTTYDSKTGLWLDDSCFNPGYLRNAADGMEGVLYAAILMRQNGKPQLQWETFVDRYVQFLVKAQNSDGSFYRAYNPDGTPYTNTGNSINGKPCDVNDPGTTAANAGIAPTDELSTPWAVRFLVTYWFVTRDPGVMKAINLAATKFLPTVFDGNLYVGGTIDNPNVTDKIAGYGALRAALALRDYTSVNGGNSVYLQPAYWLTGAQKAADYLETWQYAWDIMIEGSSQGITPPFPAAPPFAYAGSRATGLDKLGASDSDIALSYSPYELYRLYLFSCAAGSCDTHYHDVALLLQNNTKLTTELANVPHQQESDFQYSAIGLVPEAVELQAMRFELAGAQVKFTGYLPWLTDAQLDPRGRLNDVFGNPVIQNLDTVLTQTPQTLFNSNINMGNSIYPPQLPGWN